MQKILQVSKWIKDFSAWVEILKYQVERDTKDHLVQPFLAKAWSGQNGLASCPAEPWKCPILENPSLYPREIILMLYCSYCEKFSNCVKLESAQE